MHVSNWFLLGVAGLGAGALSVFAIVSAREGERRATRLAVTLAAGSAALGGLSTWLSNSIAFGAAVGVAIVCLTAIFAGLFVRGRRPVGGGRPSRQVDERDIMFARGRLRPGTPEYELYYAMRPGNRASDDRTRELPGLLSSAAERAEPLAFAAAKAAFDVTEVLRDVAEGPVAEEKIERSPSDWSGMIKDLAHSWGAIDTGIARLEPYHVYTHIGRGTGGYGDPVELPHRWAIAFTLEMDHQRVACAPAAPVVEESAHQYVEGAKIAIVLANWIRRLGYPARAHTDGNYRVIAPLVARDAGLGEIGRMGLLMTPRLGPRVRLGVVTTDMPLVADAPGDDRTVLDFCSICRKCAVNCPVGAIPADDRESIDGGLRWAIDSESCFRYWNLIGTDCASCMRVCPYSHPDSAMHNFVRLAIARSAVSRRVMLWFDDLFYGKKPEFRQPRERKIDRINLSSPRNGGAP